MQPVSVIVCAHDEENNLKTLIPDLLNQDHPNFEIIIVDDRSNDDSRELLREAAAKDSRLRFIGIDSTPARMNSKKYAITLGIKIAKNEQIILTDADCRPASVHWLSRMSESFGVQTQFVLGYSPYYKEKGFLNTFIRFETLFTAIQYIGFALIGFPYMGVGRNLAYRKSLFVSAKGFQDFLPVLGGDDDIFVNQHAKKTNTNLCIGPDVLTYSIPKESWRDYVRQKIRHLSVGKYYKLGDKIVVGLFSLSFVVTWLSGIPLLLKEPFYWIGIVLVGRMVLFLAVTYRATRRFGDNFNVWLVVFLDFLYVIYYISTGLTALLTKKIQWRS